MSTFRNPYVFALLIAVSTASLSGLYQYSIDRNPDVAKKTFAKTLATGVLAGVFLAYILNRPTPISTEPFALETPPIV